MKALQEFDTLEDAQTPVIEPRMLAPDIVIALLTKCDSVLSLQESAKVDNKAAGFMLALNGSVSEYNLMNTHPLGVEQQMLLAYLVSTTAVTQSFADTLIATANPEKLYHQDVTPEQFTACKAAYENKTIKDVSWERQRSLKITLHEDLYESKRITLFYSNEVFTKENVGRPKTVHKAGVYGVDLSGAQKSGTLHVDFGINANVTCELV